MKNLLMLVLVTASALPAFAETYSVTGYGKESSLCSASPFDDACIRRASEQAERAALENADWRCRANQGQSQLNTAYCNSSCFPNYLPPKSGPTIVRCDGSCTLQCEL